MCGNEAFCKIDAVKKPICEAVEGKYFCGGCDKDLCNGVQEAMAAGGVKALLLLGCLLITGLLTIGVSVRLSIPLYYDIFSPIYLDPSDALIGRTQGAGKDI